MNSEDFINNYAFLKGNDIVLNDLKSITYMNNQLVAMIHENFKKIEEGDDVFMRGLLLNGLRQQIKDNNNRLRGLISFLESDTDPENEEGRTKSLNFIRQLLLEEEPKENV